MTVTLIPTTRPNPGFGPHPGLTIPQESTLGKMELVKIYGFVKDSDGKSELLEYDSYGEVFFAGKWSKTFYFTAKNSDDVFFLGTNEGTDKPTNQEVYLSSWSFYELTKSDLSSISEDPRFIETITGMDDFLAGTRRIFKAVETLNDKGEFVSIATEETGDRSRRGLVKILAQRKAEEGGAGEAKLTNRPDCPEESTIGSYILTEETPFPYRNSIIEPEWKSGKKLARVELYAILKDSTLSHCKDDNGESYLVIYLQNRGNQWFVVKASNQTVAELEKGNMELRAAFLQSDNKFYRVRQGRAKYPTSITEMSPDREMLESLPDAGVYLKAVR